MTTKKPRMMITMEITTHSALHRLAKIQGRPPASVLKDFVEQCGPLFTQISDALDEAAALEKVGAAHPLEKLTALLKSSLKQGTDLQKTLEKDIRQQQLTL